MNEPIVRAGAGYPPGIRTRALGLLRAFLTTPYAPNPNDRRKFGVDLSQYNTVNLQALADYQIPCEYAMIRIGGSRAVQDEKFKQYWDAAKVAEIPRSIYTYNWPGWTVDQHIANFMHSVNILTPGDLGEGPIWADIETHPAGKTRKQISDHAIAYMRALESETGKVVGWYSAKWFVDGYMQPQDWMADFWAWMAVYATGREHPGPPVIPDPVPKKKTAIQQTGSKCDSTIFGGKGTFDTDRWTGSDALFAELFGVVHEPPPDPDLEIRLAKVELRVEKTEQEIKQLQEWQAKTDEWGNSYGRD